MDVKKDVKNKILVAVPNTGTLGYRTVAALLGFEQPKDTHIHFAFIANCLVHTARNDFVRYALEAEATHIFFIDADMVPPRDAIVKLLEADKDIIGTMMFKRKYPYQPCMYTKCRIGTNPETGEMLPELEGPMNPEDWPGGVHELEGIGTACTLIKTKVFKEIAEPWFYPLPNVGEDLSFCVKARKKGFTVWGHFDLDAGHVAEFEVKKDVFSRAHDKWLGDPANAGKLMYGGEK